MVRGNPKGKRVKDMDEENKVYLTLGLIISVEASDVNKVIDNIRNCGARVLYKKTSKSKLLLMDEVELPDGCEKG